MKFIYIFILTLLPLTDIFSQQDVYLSKRDSIKLKKLGIDLFQDDITINKFQLENIVFHNILRIETIAKIYIGFSNIYIYWCSSSLYFFIVVLE